MARVVLVTGVSRYLGARIASVLQAEPSLDRIIGADAVPPSPTVASTTTGAPLGRTEFVQADMDTAGLSRIFSSAEVDTVVHAGLATIPETVAGRPAMQDVNVLGTMQLLAACQRAPTVRKLVARSTTAVYGCSYRDPASFTEETESQAASLGGLTRDATQMEGYVRGFGRRRPDVTVSLLRFASFLGPGVDSAFTGYFSLPTIPTVLGFDPRLQFLHIDDGVEVIRRMTVEDHPGTFNVAADGVVTLAQAVRRIGRPMLRLPAPALRIGGELARSFRAAGFSPEQIELLRYGRVVDTSKIKEELGWRPRYTTLETLDDFARTSGLRRLVPIDLLDRLTGGGYEGRGSGKDTGDLDG